jgi:hypothetical protein
VLLVGGGLLALAVAAFLVASALDLRLSLIDDLTAPALARLLWIVALLLVALILVALLWIVLRRGERTLWLRGEHGGILVPMAALERLATATAQSHPDVVRAQVDLREGDGAPRGRVVLYARPFADKARLAREVDDRVMAALDDVIGRDATRLDVRTKVLHVTQLKRYLA